MSLKSAIFSGARAARDRFNQARMGDVDTQAMANRVADLAEGICNVKDANDDPIFKFEVEKPHWGTTVIVSKIDQPKNSIEFEFFASNDHYTVYVPKTRNVWQRVAHEYITEQDGLETLADWAGRNAPEAVRDLIKAAERFEYQRSYENGEWNEAPSHQ